MRALEQHIGVWDGTNAFQLLPGDPAAEAPLRATVSLAAGGALALIAYSWAHPVDGGQEGLLVLGLGDAAGTATAFWGDTWHQAPAPRALVGSIDRTALTVGYAYSGDWRWEIVIDAGTPDVLSLTMLNVIPESAASDEMAAGAYPAMSAKLRRGSGQVLPSDTESRPRWPPE